jgi:hypothetical protein
MSAAGRAIRFRGCHMFAHLHVSLSPGSAICRCAHVAMLQSMTAQAQARPAWPRTQGESETREESLLLVGTAEHMCGGRQ